MSAKSAERSPKKWASFELRRRRMRMLFRSGGEAGREGRVVLAVPGDVGAGERRGCVGVRVSSGGVNERLIGGAEERRPLPVRDVVEIGDEGAGVAGRSSPPSAE